MGSTLAYLALVLRQLCAQVPQAQRGVTRAAGQAPAVRAERHRQHRLRVACRITHVITVTVVTTVAAENLSRTKCIVCGVCSMKVDEKGLLALQCAVCCCSCLRHPISKHLMLVRRKPAPPTWHRGCAARPEHCLGHVHDAPHNSPQHHAPYHTLIDRITTHLALTLCSAPRAAP